MKQSHSRILCLLLLSVAIVLGVMISKQSSCYFNKKPLSIVAVAKPKQHQQPKQSTTTAAPDLAQAPHVRRSIPLEPSPLNEPSTEELREFPGAIVVEATETEGPPLYSFQISQHSHRRSY